VFHHLTADFCAHKQAQAQPFQIPPVRPRQAFRAELRSCTAPGFQLLYLNKITIQLSIFVS
jgi:hypothetical protein